MHHRLINECSHRLSRFALSVVAPSLREEEHRDAFLEFARGFRDVLIWYEVERDRIARHVGGQQVGANPEAAHE